jgi:Lipocalin-like domain
MDPAQRILGTWRLVHSLRIDDRGNPQYPYGADPIGYIHYSEAKIVAVQISRRARHAPADLAELKRDYLAYFGRYEIDAAHGIVRHLLEGEVLLGEHGREEERLYRFTDDDLLYLVPNDGSRREILWQRAR